MTECSSCGTELAPHQTHYPVCGKTTAHYHRQRRCLHCGAPVAEQSKTCMMCHRPVDSLPLSTSIFSGSWAGIGLGVLIIVGIVIGVTNYQADSNRVAQAGEISTPTPTPTITPTPTNTGTPTPTATVTPTPTPTPRTHQIDSGETLLYIAQQYGVSVDELKELNNIDDVRTLLPGQTLVIPPSSESGEGGTLLPHLKVYVIEAGDTLSSIAFEHGTPMEAIVAANPNLNLDLIYPGQEIIVPLSTPTPTTTPTPLPTATATPRPHYLLPQLLHPADGAIVNESTLLLNWTATVLLADDEFYVVQLTWPTGSKTEHWVQSNGLRLSQEQLPQPGPVSWTVVIKRQTGTSTQGTPTGKRLTPPGQLRTFEWR